MSGGRELDSENTWLYSRISYFFFVLAMEFSGFVGYIFCFSC